MNVHKNVLNYLWLLLQGPRAHLTKTTTKNFNKIITHSQDDNMLSKLKKTIHVLRILVSFWLNMKYQKT